MLTATDGQFNGSAQPDKFRIKIWEGTDSVVYDNLLGVADDSPAGAIIGGGSIVVHTGGKKLALLGNETESVAAGLMVTAAQLTPFVDQAVSYWAGQGVTQDRLVSLRNLEVHVAQFTDPTLGLASDSTNYVWVDADAAGYGWSLDGERSCVDSVDVDTRVRPSAWLRA